MTTIKTIMLGVGAIALWGASGLSAQTKATATIPFEFTVQNTTLPAGDYALSTSSVAHDFMTIRNAETSKAIMVLADSSASGYRGPQDKSVIVFHRIGDHYFLADVKTDAVCGRVPASKLERELEVGGQRMAAVVIPALSAR